MTTMVGQFAAWQSRCKSAGGIAVLALTLVGWPTFAADPVKAASPAPFFVQLAYEPIALHWSASEVDHATALPGGHVLVSEAFIQRRALSDEALAFVLAHEMAHSILEHERQTLHFARMLLRQDVQRTVDDMYVEIAYSFALLAALEPVMPQGELEADELGLLLASAAGFAPQAQLAFVSGLMGEDRPGMSLVQTHPPIAERLNQLRQRMPLATRIHAAGTRRLACMHDATRHGDSY